MTKPEDQAELSTVQKLHSETALIRWHELQRFFAQGVVLQLDDALDLVHVAVMLAEDNTEQLQPLLEQGILAPPSNEQARTWYSEGSELWSVVVAPYVLVQANPVNKSA